MPPVSRSVVRPLVPLVRQWLLQLPPRQTVHAVVIGDEQLAEAAHPETAEDSDWSSCDELPIADAWSKAKRPCDEALSRDDAKSPSHGGTTLPAVAGGRHAAHARQPVAAAIDGRNRVDSPGPPTGAGGPLAIGTGGLLPFPPTRRMRARLNPKERGCS